MTYQQLEGLYKEALAREAHQRRLGERMAELLHEQMEALQEGVAQFGKSRLADGEAEWMIRTAKVLFDRNA